MNYKITNNNNIEYLQFTKLLEYPNLQHAITLRTGDLDFGSIDNFHENKDQFINNYKRICDALNLDYNNVVRPKQTHTDNVEIIRKKSRKIKIFPKKLDNVDGLITNKKDVILSTGYADCIPLIFFDPEKNIIANVHSGWQGTLKQIAKKAVQKMMDEFNCEPQNIICCIGPSIRQCHFEVDKDVADLFYTQFDDLGVNVLDNPIMELTINSSAIQGNSKYYIDTVLINRLILQQMGLSEENIIDCRNLHCV